MKLLLTTLLSKDFLDCDCINHNRKFGKKKKRNGGAGARQRRSAKRAETVCGASSPSPPVPPHRPTPPASVPTPPQRTTSLIKEGCGMLDKLDKPSPKLPPKQDLGLKRKTLNPGQATERQTTLGKKFKATEIKGSMIENAIRFLDKATEQMTRDAENKLKWEKVKNTSMRGFQKSQHIPENVPFCLLCLAYKEKIHYCANLRKYVNIDDKNLILLEGVNADEVAGIFSNTGKCTMFETRKEMRTYLYRRNRINEEKEAFVKLDGGILRDDGWFVYDRVKG